MSRGDFNLSKWLEAYSERNSEIITSSENCTLADIAGDANYHLIIADVKHANEGRGKLRIYRGTKSTDLDLPDVPSSVISFYTDQVEPKIPAVGVACGSILYIHKNNKPYYKFQVPCLPVNPTEIMLWNDIVNKKNTTADIENLVRNLSCMPFATLSSRSHELLAAAPESKSSDFINALIEKPLTKYSSITCMATLNKNSDDIHEVSCPVLATETGNIYILDPQSFTILHQANTNRTKCTPFKMQATGIFTVEFRIVIACREGYLCVLRKGWLEGKLITQLIDNIVDILVIPGDNFIQVATSDRILSCYTKRGNKIWTMTFSHPIVCLCLIHLSYMNINLVAVGTKYGLIQLYHGRKCVDQTTIPGAPSAILFGKLGQEEHVLIIITIAGTIIFRILKRTADFNISAEDNIPQFQSKPLPLPKRSKLFLDQSMRERQTATDIHQSYQQDLTRIRLNSAKELVEQNCLNTDVMLQGKRLKLSAQVHGLGPKFSVIFALENMEAEHFINDLNIILHVNPCFYICSSNILKVPLLQPTVSYKIRVSLEETEYPRTIRIPIRVFVVRKNQIRPILAAVVDMPATEFPLK